ncbi:MAG: sulfatase-like hydrolase/transferase [Saprospiraceae bacterium]|jgi:phosphoglycerol transferase MdoB-like AlkP superfamily enzyme|nr:sulfatase-like hydrolase/transferase [Saprospiraceae bacterium]
MPQKYQSLYFPLRLIFIYIIGLSLWRLLFIIHNKVGSWANPEIKGLRLDISMACGVALVLFIPWILFLIFGKEWILLINKWISVLLWIFVSLVELSSILIFPEWGTTMDARAVGYLDNPSEAWASSRGFIDLTIFAFGLLIFFVGLKRLRSLFDHWHPVRTHFVQSGIFMLLAGPLLFLGLRGGWQKLPIKPSDAFYSTDMKLNFAATNKVWYLLYSLSKQKQQKIINSDAEIVEFQTDYMAAKCISDTLGIDFKNKNIILIIAEGWSADMVAYLDGKENITPNFDSIGNLSVKFTNAFSTGFRTDQGLMSLLSGIPSLANLNMPNQLDKVTQFPSIVKSLKTAGYHTSFVYGGDLNFSNLYNYLALSGYDTIISERSFPSSDDVTEWGVPDHIMVKKAAYICDQQKQPFFSTILLMSSHAPFDIPVLNEFSLYSDIPSKYKASVKYSDLALGEFFREINAKPWYDNSIFVITSDHGSTHSGYAGMDDHKRFRIPLIFFSPGMPETYLYSSIEYPCNHFDIPFTLAEKLGSDSKSFIFGRNIFCSDSSRSSYWNNDNTAAIYNEHSGQIDLFTTKSRNSTLFTDMVKKWYNALSKNND